MRFELALVVGIIFFCCWCAYIIIKMNSSLTATQQHQRQQEPPLNQQAELHLQRHQHQRQSQLDSNSNSNNNNLSSLLWYGAEPNPLDPDHYYTANPLVNGSGGGQRHATTYHRPPAPTPDGLRATAAPASQQRSFNHDRQQAASDRATSGAVRPPRLERLSRDPEESRQQQQQKQVGQNQELPAGEEEANESEEDDQAEQEEEELDEGEQQKRAPTRRELEEIEEARSFSQNDSDATERDRSGNPIRAYRRHLINGKPVAASASDSASASAPGLKDGADFDKVVDEIEEDGQQQQPPPSKEYDDYPANNSDDLAQQQQQQQPPEETSESRQLSISSKSRPQADNNDNDRKGWKGNPSGKRQHSSGMGEEIDEHSEDSSLPEKVKDSHQHRLKESLEAQQWDDDAATANPAGELANEEAGQEEEEQEEGGPNQVVATDGQNNESESDGKKSDITFKDLDLLSDGRFPFLEGLSETGAAEQESPEPQRRRAKRSLGRLIRPGGSDSSGGGGGVGGGHVERELTPDSAAEAEGGAARVAVARTDQVEPTNWPLHRATSAAGSNISRTAEPLERPAIVGLAGPTGGHQTVVADNESFVGQIGPNDGLAVQEDFSIEVLAEPPTSQPNNQTMSVTTSAVAANQAFGSTMPALNAAGNSSSAYHPFGHQHHLLAPTLSNGHSSGPQTHSLDEPYGYEGQPVMSTTGGEPGGPQVGQFDAAAGRQLASDSRPKGSKRKKAKKYVKKSKVKDSKYNAAKAASMKRKSKLKRGGLAKKRTKQGKKYAKSHKEFRGSTRGNKGAKGMGQKGAKKGALFYKDKGYKKKGFKKAYQKLESGDHKTYFDEFRDKDHSKKWKDFKDKHHYSHGKKWAANDRRKFKNMSAKELRDRKHGLGKWHQKEKSKYRKHYAKEFLDERSKKSKAAKQKHKKKGYRRR